jgi:hypothetical protein
MYATDNTTPAVLDMTHTLSWPILQERRIKARLQMFHKIVNNKIEILRVPHDGVLSKGLVMGRSCFV